MKKQIIDLIIKLLPRAVVYSIEKPWREKLRISKPYYSQNGEDIILQRLINKKDGFYVDVGAHHPTRFSNTHALYCKGWRGINIDAMPGSMALFNEVRPLDINIEIGVSEQREPMTFFSFNEPALNTFSKEAADEKGKIAGYRVLNTVQVNTMPLREILDERLPPNVTIDYLNIDAEGLDLKVLKSNNWTKYQPTVVTVESSSTNVSLYKDEIYIFMTEHGYYLQSILFNTLVFVKRSQGLKGINV